MSKTDLAQNSSSEKVTYSVKFEGFQNEELEKLLRSSSELIALEKHPPHSALALKRRAEKDIPNLVKALHSKAYYNAKVTLRSSENQVVVFFIDPGPQYPFGSVTVYPESLNISPKKLGICINRAALPADILAAEETIIQILDKRGYPFAKLLDKDVIADQKTKKIHVKFYVDKGPKAYFGKTTIEGNKDVKEKFIKRKIDWRLGQVYDPCKVERTLQALESAGIFSSIHIDHDEKLNSCGYLPFKIQVSEGKPRSIGLGIGYSTQRGYGFTGEWEHRNFHSMGERLRVSVNALQKTQEASISYLIPDYLSRGQDLIYAFEAEHDLTKGYEKTSFSFSGAFERQLSDCLRVSYGLMYEHLRTSSEKKDGDKDHEAFNLGRIPLKLRWSNVEDALDPKKGVTIFLKTVPTFQFVSDPFAYTITTLSAAIYRPLSKEDKWIVAARAQFGSILGSSINTIPGSDRFYAGSESTLRGYNYQTVSPLSKDADPIGGRSFMIYNLESRHKFSKTWGGVLFYDIGNVFSEPIPKFNAKMLQSIGIGIRYFTPVGPLRLDIAFPLNRRRAFDEKDQKHRYIDRPYQIYFSVGQSF